MANSSRLPCARALFAEQSHETKNQDVSNWELQMFERMSQIRQMEASVYSLAEGQCCLMSERHHAELRERDARLAQRDAEILQAEQMVEEARVHVAATAHINPSELYKQRQLLQAEYDKSLAEMAQLQEDRARALAAQKIEQDKTIHRSLSLAQLREEVT